MTHAFPTRRSSERGSCGRHWDLDPCQGLRLALRLGHVSAALSVHGRGGRHRSLPLCPLRGYSHSAPVVTGDGPLRDRLYLLAQPRFPRHRRTPAMDTFSRRRSDVINAAVGPAVRSEEHTSELQSLMRISYAVFCLKQNNKTTNHSHNTT